jgi:DNA-binding beta-propeller fold protein YncE
MNHTWKSTWLVGAVAFAALFAAVARAPRIHAADLTYQLVEGGPQLPAGMTWGEVSAVAVDSHGSVYVFQRSEPPILVFDEHGKFQRSFGDKMFVSPHGLRVDRDGFIWVTDRMGDQIFKFSADGKLLMTLGKKGVAGDNDARDAFNGPADVVVGANGDVFVADGESTNTRVVKLSRDGKFIKAWGTKGTAPGEFQVPHNIVIDSKGRLYVADRTNKRVQVFDQDGKFLKQMTQVGAPYGMAMSKDDVLYVADGAGAETEGKLTIVDTRNDTILGTIQGLNNPHWVALEPSGAVLVAEVRGHRVKRFLKK